MRSIMRGFLIGGHGLFMGLIDFAFKLFDLFFQRLNLLALCNQHIAQITDLLFLVRERFLGFVEVFIHSWLSALRAAGFFALMGTQMQFTQA